MTAPETRLGEALADRYRIEREVGAGGMATVYLAHDLRHDRKVAIKVLHPELAAVIGAERFLAEIRTTANLQHPHILPLYDSGAIDDRPPAVDHRLLFYVMPFVAGESLRQRLTRERQLPVADAVRITQEVAGALDYAHRQGVIHRDIKPENILLHDGSALVADFGIALAVTAAGGGRLTQTGLSLGTPAYMSPEQAMGERDIGPRTDVYSLGAVSYEMLAGEPPFTGPTSQAIVARTLTESPRPLRTERKSIAPHVEAAVLVALEKLPADRFGTAREFAEALADGRTAGRQDATTLAHALTPARRDAPSWRRAVLPSLAILSSLAALYLYATRPAPGVPPTPVEFRPVEMGTIGYFSVSKDGQFLVGTAPDSNGVPRVLLRRMDNAQVTAVPGTEGVDRAWLTPDNRALVLKNENSIRLLPLAGGGARELAPATGYVTVEWGPGDSLLTVIDKRLLMIPLDGGTSRTIATLDSAGGASFYIPRMLPGDRNALVGHRHNADSVTLMQMDLATGQTVVVHPNVQEVRPFAPDRLLWLDGSGRLLYGTYNQRTHTLGPRQVVLMEGIDDLFANADIVALRPGLPKSDLWMMDAGADQPFQVVSTDTSASLPLFSPDGGRVALALTPSVTVQRTANVASSLSTGLWVLDRTSGLRTHVADFASDAAWFPDGGRLVVLRTQPAPNPTEIWIVSADGSGSPVKAPFDGTRKFQPAVTPDGSGVVYTEARGRRLTVQPLAEGAAPRTLFDDPGDEFGSVFSPDGKWLLYGVEQETGAFLIARAWPALDRRTVVSALGFCPAFWADGGKRIYTCLPDGTLASIAFDLVAGRAVGAPQSVGFVPQKNPEFSVNPRGTDLAWIPVSPRYGTEARVLANWRADAERRLAGKQYR